MQAVDWAGQVDGLEEDEREVLRRFKSLLTCGLCDGIYSEPHQLDCNHVFCKACIIEHLAGAGQSQCPSCGVPAAPGDMVKHFQLRDAVETWQTLSRADGTPVSRPGLDEDEVPRGEADGEAYSAVAVRGDGKDGGPRADEEQRAKAVSEKQASEPTAAESDPDWMTMRSSDRDRPELPEGYNVLDPARAARRPPTEGAEVRLLVSDRWVPGEVTKCDGCFVDVELSSGRLRKHISRTDHNILFQTTPVTKYQSRITRRGANKRHVVGRSPPSSAAKQTLEPMRKAPRRLPDCSKAHPNNSDPYAFHTGETQDLNHEISSAADRPSVEAQPGAVGDQLAGGVKCIGPEQDENRMNGEPETSDEVKTAGGSQRENGTTEEDVPMDSKESPGRDEELSCIEEAETQAFVAAEDNGETIDLVDAAMEPAKRPIDPAVAHTVGGQVAATRNADRQSQGSTIPNLSKGCSNNADVLVADSESSEANDSDPLMSFIDVGKSHDTPSKAPAVVPTGDDAPAPPRPSRGSTVTFALDDILDAKEGEDSNTGTGTDDASSCPQVGSETQAALEDFLAEQSCPVGDDDDDISGAVALSKQAAHALHVKNLIAKAEEKNNRRLDRLRKRSGPIAETVRPEKQQRVELMHPESHAGDGSNVDAIPGCSCANDVNPLDISTSDAGSACTATDGRVEVNCVQEGDTQRPEQQHDELEDGQSLLVEVPQSPVAKAAIEQTCLSSPPINAVGVDLSYDGKTASHACQNDRDDEDDEHVESSLPMGSQYTQASQQTPAPDAAAFEVIRETPDSAHPEGSSQSACSTQHGSCSEPELAAPVMNPHDGSNGCARKMGSSAPVPPRCLSGSEADARDAKETSISPPATRPESSLPGQLTSAVLVNETPKVAQCAGVGDAPLMRPPPSANYDSTILVPDSQPFGDPTEMAPPRTAGPKSQPKSPAISTVQDPGSPVGPKLGGAAGGRSRYPRSSGSSPLRSLSLASPVNTTTTTTIASVATGGVAVSNTDVAAKASGPSDGVVTCNLFSWGNSKKVYVSAQSREKGLAAVSVQAPETAAGPDTVAQATVLPGSASSNSRVTAAPPGRGRLTRGANSNQHGRGRGLGFHAPRPTGGFQPPRPNVVGQSPQAAAHPASSIPRPQLHQNGQRRSQQGSLLSIQLGARGIRRATPRELLGTPESQEPTTNSGNPDDRARFGLVSSLTRHVDETGQTEHAECTEQTLEQHDEDNVGSTRSRATRHSNPTILFTSVAEDDRYGDVDSLEQIAFRLNAAVTGSDQWDLKSSRTTHLVTSHGKSEGHAKRTVKYFAAILKGNWIVSVDWVIQSKQAGHWLPEAPYEMKGDAKAIDGPRKGRECKNSDGQLPKPFEGLRICLYGSFASPSRSELEGLIELGGGMVARDPSSSQGADVVVIENKKECQAMSMFKPVKSSWILDSISNFKPLLPPPEHHLTLSGKRKQAAR